MTTPAESPYMTYQRASGRWWRAKEIDAAMGTHYAAALVGPMRAAWAALVAARGGAS